VAPCRAKLLKRMGKVRCIAEFDRLPAASKPEVSAANPVPEITKVSGHSYAECSSGTVVSLLLLVFMMLR